MPKAFIYSVRNYGSRIKDADDHTATEATPGVTKMLTRSVFKPGQDVYESLSPWHLGLTKRITFTSRGGGVREKRKDSSEKSYHHLSLVTRFYLGLRMTRLRALQQTKRISDSSDSPLTQKYHSDPAMMPSQKMYVHIPSGANFGTNLEVNTGANPGANPSRSTVVSESVKFRVQHGASLQGYKDDNNDRRQLPTGSVTTIVTHASTSSRQPYPRDDSDWFIRQVPQKEISEVLKCEDRHTLEMNLSPFETQRLGQLSEIKRGVDFGSINVHKQPNKHPQNHCNVEISGKTQATINNERKLEYRVIDQRNRKATFPSLPKDVRDDIDKAPYYSILPYTFNHTKNHQYNSYNIPNILTMHNDAPPLCKKPRFSNQPTSCRKLQYRDKADTTPKYSLGSGCKMRNESPQVHFSQTPERKERNYACDTQMCSVTIPEQNFTDITVSPRKKMKRRHSKWKDGQMLQFNGRNSSGSSKIATQSTACILAAPTVMPFRQSYNLEGGIVQPSNCAEIGTAVGDEFKVNANDSTSCSSGNSLISNKISNVIQPDKDTRTFCKETITTKSLVVPTTNHIRVATFKNNIPVFLTCSLPNQIETFQENQMSIDVKLSKLVYLTKKPGTSLDRATTKNGCPVSEAKLESSTFYPSGSAHNGAKQNANYTHQEHLPVNQVSSNVGFADRTFLGTPDHFQPHSMNFAIANTPTINLSNPQLQLQQEQNYKNTKNSSVNRCNDMYSTETSNMASIVNTQQGNADSAEYPLGPFKPLAGHVQSAPHLQQKATASFVSYSHDFDKTNIPQSRVQDNQLAQSSSLPVYKSVHISRDHNTFALDALPNTQAFKQQMFNPVQTTPGQAVVLLSSSSRFNKPTVTPTITASRTPQVREYGDGAINALSFDRSNEVISGFFPSTIPLSVGQVTPYISMYGSYNTPTSVNIKQTPSRSKPSHYQDLKLHDSIFFANRASEKNSDMVNSNCNIDNQISFNIRNQPHNSSVDIVKSMPNGNDISSIKFDPFDFDKQDASPTIHSNLQSCLNQIEVNNSFGNQFKSSQINKEDAYILNQSNLQSDQRSGKSPPSINGGTKMNTSISCNSERQIISQIDPTFIELSSNSGPTSSTKFPSVDNVRSYHVGHNGLPAIKIDTPVQSDQLLSLPNSNLESNSLCNRATDVTKRAKLRNSCNELFLPKDPTNLKSEMEANCAVKSQMTSKTHDSLGDLKWNVCLPKSSNQSLVPQYNNLSFTGNTYEPHLLFVPYNSSQFIQQSPHKLKYKPKLSVTKTHITPKSLRHTPSSGNSKDHAGTSIPSVIVSKQTSPCRPMSVASVPPLERSKPINLGLRMPQESTISNIKSTSNIFSLGAQQNFATPALDLLSSVAKTPVISASLGTPLVMSSGPMASSVAVSHEHNISSIDKMIKENLEAGGTFNNHILNIGNANIQENIPKENLYNKHSNKKRRDFGGYALAPPFVEKVNRKRRTSDSFLVEKTNSIDSASLFNYNDTFTFQYAANNSIFGNINEMYSYVQDNNRDGSILSTSTDYKSKITPSISANMSLSSPLSVSPATNIPPNGNTKLPRHPLENMCPVCYRIFSRSWLLKGHMRTHTGERPYQCSFPDCHKAFADRSNLRSHMLTHTAATKSFSCPRCGRTFSQKRYLHKHTIEVCRIQLDS